MIICKSINFNLVLAETITWQLYSYSIGVQVFTKLAKVRTATHAKQENYKILFRFFFSPKTTFLNAVVLKRWTFAVDEWTDRLAAFSPVSDCDGASVLISSDRLNSISSSFFWSNEKSVSVMSLQSLLYFLCV